MIMIETSRSNRPKWGDLRHGHADPAHVLHRRSVCRGNKVLWAGEPNKETGRGGRQQENRVDSQANHPSSSSRRLGAGNGAPGPSVVGSWT
jgi:hypothetical protein